MSPETEYDVLKNVKDMENTVFFKTLLQFSFNKICDVAQVAIIHKYI
jgi:hypothetical protein